MENENQNDKPRREAEEAKKASSILRTWITILTIVLGMSIASGVTYVAMHSPTAETIQPAEPEPVPVPRVQAKKEGAKKPRAEQQAFQRIKALEDSFKSAKAETYEKYVTAKRQGRDSLLLFLQGREGDEEFRKFWQKRSAVADLLIKPKG